MYGRDKRVLLREYLQDGWSKAALSQKLGVSRQTLYDWINSGQLDRDLRRFGLCHFVLVSPADAAGSCRHRIADW